MGIKGKMGEKLERCLQKHLADPHQHPPVHRDDHTKDSKVHCTAGTFIGLHLITLLPIILALITAR